MNKKELRIVFMGTPGFAVESLKQLVENEYNIVGVVTMPDKPAGRGHKVQFSPVKEYALSKGLTILQPEKLKAESFLSELKALNADLQIVIAFRMLPEAVWNMPRLGTFNLHASLLPQYRGAAPINWAIINGEKETGITTFFITHEIDTGKIIQQEKIAISETDNAEDIHDKLMFKGAELVLQTVNAILRNDIHPKTQEELFLSENELKAAPKIFKETCRINFADTIEAVYNFIRGLSPYPAAWTELVGPDETAVFVKIFETEKVKAAHNHAPGTVLTDEKKVLDVAVSDGYIRVKSIQLPGKKRLSTEDFLRGFNMNNQYSFR
jgi:methionyl-tRNA formyltransferase